VQRRLTLDLTPKFSACFDGGKDMQKFKDLRRLEAEEYFDLAEMLPENSGLPFVVFIMDRMESRHGVRLKVAPRLKWHRSEMLTVVLRPRLRVIDGELNPREFTLLSRWINLNRKTLLKYWENEIDTLGAYKVLKPLRVLKGIKYRRRRMTTWEFLLLLKPLPPDARDSVEEPDSDSGYTAPAE